jgi:hypothetical protein
MVEVRGRDGLALDPVLRIDICIHAGDDLNFGGLVVVSAGDGKPGPAVSALSWVSIKEEKRRFPFGSRA